MKRHIKSTRNVKLVCGIVVPLSIIHIFWVVLLSLHHLHLLLHNDKIITYDQWTEGNVHTFAPQNRNIPSKSPISKIVITWISGFEQSCIVCHTNCCYFFKPFFCCCSFCFCDSLSHKRYVFFPAQEYTKASKDIYYFVFRALYRNRTQ